MSKFPILKVPSSLKSADSAIPPILVLLGSSSKEPGDQPKFIWGEIFSSSLFICILSVSFLLFLIMPPLGLLSIIGSVSYRFYQLDQDYKQRLKYWEKQKSKYQRQKANSEQIKRRGLTPQELRNYRKQQLIKALAQTTPHNGIGSQATKGSAEDMFKRYLNSYFSGKVFTGLTVTIPGFEYPYSPDFTYIDKQLNLYIDIEIDEPYVFHTGEPTHFKGCNRDKRRDRFFLDKNWIVIRFAEEQIYKHPKECCKFVAIVALKFGIPFPESLKNVGILPSVPHWTEAEAIKMAASKTRNCYKFQSS